MAGRSRYPAELQERAVRVVTEHAHEHTSQWAAIESIAAKIGVADETQVGAACRDRRRERPGLSTEERQRLKDLERENQELRRANEILKAAAGFFGAELDGRHPK